MKKKATAPLGNLLLTRVTRTLLAADGRGGGGYRVSYRIGLLFPIETDHPVRRRNADDGRRAGPGPRVRRTVAVERRGGASDERYAGREAHASLDARVRAP